MSTRTDRSASLVSLVPKLQLGNAFPEAPASSACESRQAGAWPEWVPKPELGNQRESLLELLPIKLTGGFIAVDYHIGCFGCTFCLCRRYPLWRKVFAAKCHFDPSFLTPEIIFELLASIRPFYRAKVPIRFGHNTDAWLQWEFGARLLSLVPADQPFVMLTRRPITKERASLVSGHENLVVKLTITPSSRLLRHHTEIDRHIISAHLIPRENLYVAIAPLMIDNVREAFDILKRLPEGIWLDIKPLTVTGVPGLDASMQPPEEAILELRERASSMGFVVTDYFGCLARIKIARSFYKARSSPSYVRQACTNCPNHGLCHGEMNLADLDGRIRKEAGEIGLILGRLDADRFDGGVLAYESFVPCSRGDETYLSELAGCVVELSNTIAGSEGGCFSSEDRAIQERWRKVGMLPTDTLSRIALKIWEVLEESCNGGYQKT